MKVAGTVAWRSLLAASLLLGCKSGGDSDSGNGGATGDGGSQGVAGDTGNGGASSTGGSGQGGDPGNGGSVGAGGSAGAGGSGTGGAGGATAGASGQGGGGGYNDGYEQCATHPYCLDFEDLAVGGKPKSGYASPGNMLAVTEAKAYSGKRSLYVEASGGLPANFSLFLKARLKNPKFVGYSRIMVFIDALPATGNGSGYWNMINMGGTVTTNGKFGGGVAFGGPDGNQRSWIIYQGGGPAGMGTDCTKPVMPPVVPLQKWVCVELKVDETATVPYGVKVDGKEIAAFALKAMNTGSNCASAGPNDNWYVPDVTSFGFGWNHSHDQTGTAKMYIDDVVVDEVPIGCPPPP